MFLGSAKTKKLSEYLQEFLLTLRVLKNLDYFKFLVVEIDIYFVKTKSVLQYPRWSLCSTLSNRYNSKKRDYRFLWFGTQKF